MTEIEVRAFPVGRRDPVKIARRCRKCNMMDGQTYEPSYVKEFCAGCSTYEWYLKNVGEYR